MIFLDRPKKGQSMMMTIVIVTFLLILAAVVLVIIFGRSASKTKNIEACNLLAFGEGQEGYCVTNEAECRSQGGTLNPISKKGNCAESTPVCCIGTPPADTSGASGPSNQSATGTAAAKKGTIEFWAKAKLDSSGYLIVSDAFQKFNLNDIKAGNTDFKAKKGSSFDIQVRGGQDTAYCAIEVVGKGNPTKGACSADKGVSMTYTFSDAADYDIKMAGYDNKDGTSLAGAVADIKVE